MNNKTIQRIISGILVVGLLGWLGYSLFLKPKPGMNIVIESKFVAGLEPDNLVIANGLEVGRVKSMQLKQDFSGKVIVNILIKDENLRISKDGVKAVITDADLMGTKQLDLVFSSGECTNCLVNNDTIYSELGSYFDTEINELEPMMKLIEDTYSTLDTAVKSWRQQNLGDYNTKAREAERDIKEMIANFNSAMNDGTELMKKTTTSFERISKDAEVIMANFEEESLKEIKDNVAAIQVNIDKADFDKTAKSVENTMSKWNATLESITQTKELYTAVVKKLEAGSTGSLAQVLNDPRFQSTTDTSSLTIADYAKRLEDIRLYPEKYTYFLGR